MPGLVLRRDNGRRLEDGVLTGYCRRSGCPVSAGFGGIGMAIALDAALEGLRYMDQCTSVSLDDDRYAALKASEHP